MDLLSRIGDETPFGRKLGGVVLISVAAIGFLLSGLQFFTLPDAALLAVLTTGGALLGVGNVTDIFKNKK